MTVSVDAPASLTLRILGCGSSGGVPRVASGWGACNPEDPRNRRRRCSILVERVSGGGRTTVLVDTSPDLREQLLDADVQRLDAVLYTHAHADHTHGIDDLRPLVITMRARIPVYADTLTRSLLTTRFGYCFETPPGSAYPPILDLRDLPPALTSTGRAARSRSNRSPWSTAPRRRWDFGFGSAAYMPDVSLIPARAGRGSTASIS